MRLTVDEADRLDRFLARQLPDFSRTRLSRVIDSGDVAVDGNPQRSSFRVFPGMVVELSLPAESPAHDLTPAEVALEVAFEDEHLIIVNKPRGLATHPAATLKEPSLVNALLARGMQLSAGSASYRPGIVHRLDKMTTGLIIAAKSDLAHARLARQIEKKEAKRIYLAAVSGCPSETRFTISAPIGRDPKKRQKMAVVAGGKPATTHIEVLRSVPGLALLSCELETGRTHQIRVHLSAILHPVLGDPVYAPKNMQGGPMLLHAWRLRLVHPISGEPLEAEAPVPQDWPEMLR